MSVARETMVCSPGVAPVPLIVPIVEAYTPIISYDQISAVQQLPVSGSPQVVKGRRLVDASASYGIGLETFALGFPVHFDSSWKTLLNKEWEDLRFAAFGGSSAFRKPKFSLWIGYDF